MERFSKVCATGALIGIGLVLSLAGCVGQGNAGSSSSSDSGAAVQTQNDARAPFPSFSGSDLQGNAVNSESLFSGNKVTVVNFWFSDCPACIDELPSLEALNSELAEKGGELVGINTYTLDGSKEDIEIAKQILDQNGATYRNVRFENEGGIGMFVGQIVAYPTTYVVDSGGGISLASLLWGASRIRRT